MSGQIVPNQTAPTASAPAVAPVPAAPAAPVSPENQDKALEALHQTEAAQVVTDQAAQNEAAKRQREQDELKIKQEKEAKKAAAVEQSRIAKARKDAAAAEQARIAKAKKEAAQPREPKPEVQNAHRPAQVVLRPPPANTNALSAKEQKLADLLRRYQADEITPYQYHLERARIIAEP